MEDFGIKIQRISMFEDFGLTLLLKCTKLLNFIKFNSLSTLSHLNT